MQCFPSQFYINLGLYFKEMVKIGFENTSFLDEVTVRHHALVFCLMQVTVLIMTGFSR